MSLEDQQNEHDEQNRQTGEGKEGRQYHHGDLRRALLDAALHLASERGIAGFTLREVARQAGVSHNAPYHHFADKAALVEALALENFGLLTADLRAAYEGAPGTALDKVLAMGVAYVQFALQHAAAFRLMFRPELHQHSHADALEDDAVAQAGDAAYRILLDAIAAAQQAGLIATNVDNQILAVTTWSTVHGLAILLLDGSIKKLLPHPLDDAQLASYVVQALASGIMKR